MYIQQVNSSFNKNTYNQRNEVSFSATLTQAAKAVREANNICDGRRSFLTNIIESLQQIIDLYVKKMQTSSEITYKLGEKNPVPDALKNPRARVAWMNLDNYLNNSGFKCSPKSTCGCGEGIARGEFAKDLFKGMNVENPDVLILK